ncbi:hypothetical protein [Sutcliffiella horikoshii]|uniref:hypothetical protein n=1 Tax=Sutcliffiella horikoshii TaxID=79883 RepID=UPI003CF78F02
MSALAFVWCSFYFTKGDMWMNESLRDQLQQWRKQTADQRQVHQEKKPPRKREELTDRDIRELMGTGRPRYARGKGGAYRQR